MQAENSAIATLSVDIIKAAKFSKSDEIKWQIEIKSQSFKRTPQNRIHAAALWPTIVDATKSILCYHFFCNFWVSAFPKLFEFKLSVSRKFVNIAQTFYDVTGRMKDLVFAACLRKVGRERKLVECF